MCKKCNITYVERWCWLIDYCKKHNQHPGNEQAWNAAKKAFKQQYPHYTGV